MSEIDEARARSTKAIMSLIDENMKKLGEQIERDERKARAALTDGGE